MKIFLRVLTIAILLVFAVYAADDVVSVVHGTVTKVDSASKTIVVKTKDGTEHTFHYVDKTTVTGVDATEAAAKDSYKGIKVGSDVVVQYSKKGTEDTAHEVDKLTKDSVKTVDGTVEKVSKDGKTVTIKTADGTEKTFEVVGKGAEVSAQAIGKGTAKGAKVTVLYTENAGKKIAHFFE